MNYIKVANLFCVGSPLGVFLVMRGAKADTIIPPKETVSYSIGNIPVHLQLIN